MPPRGARRRRRAPHSRRATRQCSRRHPGTARTPRRGARARAGRTRRRARRRVCSSHRPRSPRLRGSTPAPLRRRPPAWLRRRFDASAAAPAIVDCGPRAKRSARGSAAGEKPRLERTKRVFIVFRSSFRDVGRDNEPAPGSRMSRRLASVHQYSHDGEGDHYNSLKRTEHVVSKRASLILHSRCTTRCSRAQGVADLFFNWPFDVFLSRARVCEREDPTRGSVSVRTGFFSVRRL